MSYSHTPKTLHVASPGTLGPVTPEEARWLEKLDLTRLPRHVAVKAVRSYVRGPRIAAVAGRIAPLSAPLVRLTARVGPLGPRAEQSP